MYENSEGRKCLKALDFSKLTIIKEECIYYSRVYRFKDIEEKRFDLIIQINLLTWEVYNFEITKNIS